MSHPAGAGNPEAPNPQLPVVQRLRVQYAKRGRLRFISHRDFGRAFERAVRRSGVPIAFSSGYSPHPRISYAGAAPTGAASEAEYLEVALTRTCDPDELRLRLDESLPPDLDLVRVVQSEPGGGSLADLLEASAWELVLPEADPAAVASAVEAFLAETSVEVERMGKKGMRTFDAREATVSLSSASADVDGVACAILTLVVRHGVPSVRPDDVLAGLRSVGGLEPPVTPRVNRLAQGPLDVRTGTVGDPFALGRDAS
ncbi:TIGR03936 family radical SAM-associated protein [Solicola sp. PLA-1-18]|uniref:TIGR03936 family radical SAM-associated protein n=1 Tax=Solicola sp. PLA-1-18 TaxID=3380532 RepID=UPI003B75FB3E